MAAHPSESSPWPAQTAPPSPRSKRKRQRTPVVAHRAASALQARQLADQDEVAQAKNECWFDSGNNVTSCYPISSTVIPQHEYAAFVWNSNLPQFTQTKLVNVYLFHADSLELVNAWYNLPNPPNQAGSVQYYVNDSWWGDRGSQWDGQNISYPFYWIVIRNDKTLDDGSAVPQPIFTAIQTTYADSVVASMSSTSAAASSSAARQSSLRSSGASGSYPSSTNANLQPNSNSSAFPHWAIAVIVVLGFLAIVASCVLVFLIMRRMRRRSQPSSNRGSMGSASPMMANVQTDHGGGGGMQSPLLGSAALAGVSTGAAVAETGRPSSQGHRPPSVVLPDGASTISRTHSVGDAGPFSGADAAIMADAFRKALRKPDFAGRPVEEGDSPDGPPKDVELLSRELAEEGRDIRSVSSSRDVKVETLSDSGDTVQDHPH